MVTNFTDWGTGLYLAHHGKKGQKWGIRHYQNPDGSLTPLGREHYGVGQGGNKKLSRKFNREARKLKRYEDRQNKQLQAEKAAKYSKRAKIAGGAAAGLAGAAAGTLGLKINAEKMSNIWMGQNALHANQAKAIGQKLNERAYGKNMYTTLDNKRSALTADSKNLSEMFKSETAKATEAKNNLDSWSKKDKNYFTATKILAGGAAVAGGIAVYNAIRSKVAKSRLTDAGHAKAVAKYKSQYEKMAKMFASTPYSELIKKKNLK